MKTSLTRYLLITFAIVTAALSSGCDNGKQQLLAEKEQLQNKIKSSQRELNRLTRDIAQFEKELIPAQENFENLKAYLHELKDLEQNIREQATSNTYGISKPELEISDIKLDFDNFRKSVYLSMTLTNNTNHYIDRGYVDVEFNSDSAGKIRLSESEFTFGSKPLGPKESRSTRITLYESSKSPFRDKRASSDKRILFTKEYWAVVTLRDIIDIDKKRHHIIPSKNVYNSFYSDYKKIVSRLQSKLRRASSQSASTRAEISENRERIRVINSKLEGK